MATTYEPIATNTLGTAVNSVTFSSIPATYTDLRVVALPISNNAPNTVSLFMRFNADTGTNYSFTALYGTGSTAGSFYYDNNSSIYVDSSNDGASFTVPALMTADIFSYAGSTYKTCLTTGSTDKSGSGEVNRNVGLWRNTAAITSITLLSSSGSVNFKIGSTFTLYGIKNA